MTNEILEDIHIQDVHGFCDKCGKELSDKEKIRNLEHLNKEYPICDSCFENTMLKIKYIGEFR